MSFKTKLSLRALRNCMDSSSLPLIIDDSINFSFGFNNTDYQTNKLQFLQMEQAMFTHFILLHYPLSTEG